MDKIFKQAEFSRVDKAARMVWITLLAPDVYDLQGDRISQPEIQKSAIGFMANWQVVGEMHTKEARAQVVESWVDERGWNVGTLIKDDALWAKIDNGTYKGGSIGGYGMRTPDGEGRYTLTDLDVMEYSIVTNPAVPAAKVRIMRSANAEDDDTEYLAEQIQAGKVSPRVRSVKLADCWQTLLDCINKLNPHLAIGEESNTPESDMTEAEVKALLAPITEKLDTLAKSIEGAAPTESAKADEPQAVTQADVEKMLEPITGALENLSGAIAEIGKQAKPAAATKSDGGDTGNDERIDPFAFNKTRVNERNGVRNA